MSGFSLTNIITRESWNTVGTVNHPLSTWNSREIRFLADLCFLNFALLAALSLSSVTFPGSLLSEDCKANFLFSCLLPCGEQTVPHNPTLWYPRPCEKSSPLQCGWDRRSASTRGPQRGWDVASMITLHRAVASSSQETFPFTGVDEARRPLSEKPRVARS